MICIAVVLLAIAAPASAATIRSATSGTIAPQPWQTWIDKSRIPIPSLPLELHFQRCGPTGGCYLQGNDGIWVSPVIAPSHRRYVFLHELGHWFDDRALNGRDRLVFLHIAHSHAETWDGDGGEVFADAFAACARWPRLSDDRSGQTDMFAVGPRVYRHVCEWMQVIAARYPADSPGGL